MMGLSFAPILETAFIVGSLLLAVIALVVSSYVVCTNSFRGKGLVLALVLYGTTLLASMVLVISLLLLLF